MADNVKKNIKTLTEEEKTAILKRAEKVDPRKVASEFGTSWQAVVALVHAKDKASKEEVETVRTRRNRMKNTSEKAEKKAAASVSKPQEDLSSMPLKKSADFTMEERLAVIARAGEIGLTKAAKEAHVNKYTITGWQRILKKHANAAKTEPEAAASEVAAEAVSSENPTVVKAHAERARKDISSSSSASLEVENVILKEKVAALTAQVEKLKAALNALA